MNAGCANNGPGQKPARSHHAKPPRLEFLSAPYRRIHALFPKPMEELAQKNPDRTIAVLIPELVKRTGGNIC